MCGIVGFYGPDNVVQDIVIGLTALQHRGQDAAGIATFDDNFHLCKGNGLISDVFKPKQLKKLKGNIGIGHARYTTQGSGDAELAQPFGRGVNFEFAVADLGAVRARIVRYGYPIRLDVHERWYRVGEEEVGVRQLLVQDPDGYLLRFQEALGMRPSGGV